MGAVAIVFAGGSSSDAAIVPGLRCASLSGARYESAVRVSHPEGVVDFGEGFLGEVPCACVAGIKYLVDVGGVGGELGATATQWTK